MGELIDQIKDGLFNAMNSHAISPDSIEGIAIIFALAFIAWGIYKKASEYIKWSLAVILFCQVMYWLGQTSMNNLIPLSSVFKYDILQAIAQCFVGTKFCDVVLWIDAFIRSVSIVVWDAVTPFLGIIGDFFKRTWSVIWEHLQQNVEPLPSTTTVETETSETMSILYDIRQWFMR